MTQTDTLIIGGGLSGLRLADLMQQAGQEYVLVEARDRLGGRILSATACNTAFDLGPAWFWPGQPRIAALINRFGLEIFDQYSSGNFRFENAQGTIAEGRAAGSMQGSLRLSGGMGELTEALASTLHGHRILLEHKLVSLHLQAGEVMANFAGKPAITARRVVLAVPPRVALELSFSPALPAQAIQTLSEIPTWMAGQAKAIAVYDRPFWRDAGLSGDAMSHIGPMVEIHDASPKEGGPFALFGFIGVPADKRTDQPLLRQAVIDQLARLFGPGAPDPQQVLIKDWATDPQTAVGADLKPLHGHPRYGLPTTVRNIWGGNLVFSGTETATEFGGFLEGALEAAEYAFHTLAEEELSL